MKQTIKYILVGALMPAALTSCLDEVKPTDGVTQEQLEAMASTDPLVSAITKHMNQIVNTDQYCDVGYPSMMIYRDVCTADMPVYDPSYYYFRCYSACLQLGDWQIQTDIWNFYNQLVHKCNIALAVCTESDALNMATALCYRAHAHMDMARMYEFKATGTSLDSYLPSLGGLTVPIVTETTTEQQSLSNPRAPYYQMWRCILTDLNRAEALLVASGASGEKNKASLGVVKGLKARLWLDIATRFWRYPADMATALAHEGEGLGEGLGDGYSFDPLGVASEREAWQKAADAAREAISLGYTPLTRAQWFDTSTGFNNASSNNSWMWAILMGSSDEMATTYVWQSWISFMSPEASYGVACSNYGATFMLDKALFDQISPADWRRYTWIDPADFEEGEEAFKRNYADKTNLDYDGWSQCQPYEGFKYHPGNGNGQTSSTGNCVDIPLMRIEEMYFIEAEALAHLQGVGAGANALADFLNNIGARYEDGSYSCTASTLEDFTAELVLQKRIEHWAEGVVYFDMRRLGYAVTRGYDGTNHPVSYRLNSKGNGYVPTWTTFFIPLRENRMNPACISNPDPSPLTESQMWY